MKTKYDIIVIGAGSAGLSISLFTAKAGLKTLLIDKTGQNLGGDCLNFGCIPSKALIHAARLIHNGRRAQAFGLSLIGKPDISRIMEYIQQAQAKIRVHEDQSFLEAQGIDVALGSACFVSTSAVTVGSRTYQSRRIVIATGSRPTIPTIKGLEKVQALTNETLFDITQLPQRLLVLGAGPVGVELGQALSRLGSEVTLVTKGNRILKADPEDTSAVLHDQLEKEGIRILLNTEVKEFISANECRVNQDNNVQLIGFDAVLLATGRALNIEGLNLEAAKVNTRDDQIETDSRLRTSNRNVFVCGDVAGRLKFSHEAEHHARILLNNFFSPIKRSLKTRLKSWVTFSDPQIATFGLNRAELEASRVPYQTLSHPLLHDDRAVTDQYQYGKVVFYISKKTLTGKQRLLGGSIVAPDAGEMIQELLLLMQTGGSINQLFEKIYPYPVAARANQLAIVKHRENELTPLVAQLLRLLFRLI